MNVSGATNSPKRCSIGTIAKIRAPAMLIQRTSHSHEPMKNCTPMKLALTTTDIQAAMLSIRARRAALAA